MTEAAAKGMAVALLGEGVQLVTLNGVRCVLDADGKRIGSGPTWGAAIRSAAINTGKVKRPQPFSNAVALANYVTHADAFRRYAQAAELVIAKESEPVGG